MEAPLPSAEIDRLAALRASRILDTPPEAAFDRIASLAARMLGMPSSAVSFVDADRQWFKAACGLDFRQTSRAVSFCAHAILEDDVFIVSDATADPRFAESALVVGEPHIRFYAGAPLRTPDGLALGTLCVFDQQPRRLSRRQRAILRDLAALAVDELALRSQIAAREQAETALRAQHLVLKEVNASIEQRIADRTAELTQLNEVLRAEITQRAVADAARHESEQRFRQIFHQASDGMFVHDAEGRFVDVNDAACAALGYSREELLRLGVPDIETTHVPAEGFRFWRELPLGESDTFEGRHRRKDGSVLPVELRVSAIETAEGRRLIVSARDITTRKRAELLLQTRARQQEAVVRLGASALSGDGGGIEGLLDEAAALVGQTLDVEICRIHEHVPARGAFVVRAGLDVTPANRGQEASSDDAHGAAGYVLRTAQPVLIENVETETRFEITPQLLAIGAHSGIAAPIGGAGPNALRFGVLGAFSRQLRVFTADDMTFLRSVANILAEAIARRRGEDELRSVKTRYERIVANTPGMVYQYLTRPGGSVALPFVSEGCREIYGVEPSELQAHPQWMTDHVHPDDRPECIAAMRAAETALSPLHWDGRLLLPSGIMRWVRVDSRPERLPDGSFLCDGIVMDVTARRRAQEELNQSQERFRQAILHSPLPVMLHTNDGEVLTVNHAWTHQTGYMWEDLPTIEDWIGRAYAEEAQREGVRRFLADMLNHVGTAEFANQRIRCADGSERIWDFSSANLGLLPDGRWMHITTATDVTERALGEAALRAAMEEAERANNAKSEFLSRMSHELRTPLNAILGFGQVLELSQLDEQDALSVGHILKGGRHLLALVDEVLDVTRVEAGELNLTLGPVDSERLMHECVGFVTRLAQARNIVCIVETAVPKPPLVLADEQRLRQMLLNLLSNAIKYNRDGGRVTLGSERTPVGRLRLKVTDTGPGISAKEQERLFVPFERLGQEFFGVEGTGLGLVVSQRLAEAMDGGLGVDSQVGQGSTFWIDLPMAPASLEPDPESGEGTAAIAAGAARPEPTATATLLYIEDNESNLQVVQALLARQRPRWIFLTALTGESGLREAQRHLPDLILLDLQLPGMQGDAVLAELRADPTTHRIPVVLLSADATLRSRQRLLALGADDYLPKPFNVSELLELLDRANLLTDGRRV